MAAPDPNTPQVVDPERLVDLTRLLQIRGPLGVLNVADIVVPVVNLGDVVTRTVTVLQPSYRSSDVFSAGILIAPAAGTILADTGALAEGVYDIILTAESRATDSSEIAFVVEHRNAANAANLAVWNYLGDTAGMVVALGPFPFAYEFGENERLRVTPATNIAVGETVNAVLFARRRD